MMKTNPHANKPLILLKSISSMEKALNSYLGASIELIESIDKNKGIHEADMITNKQVCLLVHASLSQLCQLQHLLKRKLQYYVMVIPNNGAAPIIDLDELEENQQQLLSAIKTLRILLKRSPLYKKDLPLFNSKLDDLMSYYKEKKELLKIRYEQHTIQQPAPPLLWI
ncbi:hypothetical protein [Alkalihalophilus marmarensis]|uniref:hypothetical protein n=1 Tax=Alkalihalophilus marmarensis TaxID=521377 RepID=UPI002E1FE94E|nr:hypothetical protein [Alkalihalophilus marmarensis]